MFCNLTDKFWKYRDKCLKYEKKKIKMLYYFYLYLCKTINRKLNSGIPISENINKFITPHGLSGIYISKGAYIGKNCIIFHQVTIGSNTLSDSKKNGAPILGENVYVGVGAKIIGNVKIGNNVRIGANCIVVEDVPDNCTVVMNKPRVIKHDSKKNNKFFEW